MPLVKLLAKDLIIDDETKELVESGTEILAKGRLLTRETRNNLMDEHRFSVDTLLEEYVTTVVDRIAKFLKENPEDADYIRAEPLGHAYKFSEVSDTVKDIQGLLKGYKSYDFAKVPGVTQQDIFNHVEATEGSIQKINGFDPKNEENAEDAHRDITKQLRKEYNNIFDLWSALSPAEIKSGAGDSDAVIEQFEAQSKERFEKFDAAQRQYEQALKGISDHAAEEGIAAESSHFHNQSAKHEESAKKWLWCSIFLGVALLALVVWFYFCDKPPVSNTFAWNHFIPRFSILGILIFLEIILIGIYRAERHNAIVNKHRANALNTFETMTAATLSQDVKDAVTLTAAGAIYAPQETGFSKRGANASTAHVADILASLATKRS